jgi:hypothetical protein
MALRKTIAVLSIWIAAPALADSGIGIGVAAGPTPALSLQYEASPRTAYHLTAHFGDDTAALTADYQRFLVPGFGHGGTWILAFYAGAGLGGEATHEQDGEAYSLRLPLGVQWDLLDLRLSAFLEAAPTLGPLPATTLGAVATGGLRARF